ncbi:TVP38/TMEM64 family protein [Thiohalomonas denitrificans]|uniref:TVP38/TMEM64 family protein n=1 Tax=Thiohalomonas denitrificans TaxID=415747 RepID=UPI0026F239F6|nr:TVP38/TMEM64 family protein [Thiohalomonas denitrificans]
MAVKHFGRVLMIVLLGLGIVLALSNRDQFEGKVLEEWVRSAGFWAPLLFVAIFALAVVFFVPSTLMMLAGGALFGPYWGMLYNLAGATTGAVLAFVAARHIAADRVRRQAHGRLRQVIRGAETEGWRFVAFMRLVPVVPFALLNYAFGLTQIPLASYTMTTFAFLGPGAFAYAYLGFAGREVVEGDAAPPELLLAFVILGLITLLAFVARRRHRLRKRLQER